MAHNSFKNGQLYFSNLCELQGHRQGFANVYDVSMTAKSKIGSEFSPISVGEIRKTRFWADSINCENLENVLKLENHWENQPEMITDNLNRSDIFNSRPIKTHYFSNRRF